MEMHEAKCPAIDYICNEKKDKKLPKMRLVYTSKIITYITLTAV